MVFSPMHVDRKGNVKPNLVEHAFSKGCSIQRGHWANDEELFAFIRDFLEGKDDRAWLGVATGVCADVRRIQVPDSAERAFCVYDTALKANPAHGEIGKARPFRDEDRLELRKLLMDGFGAGNLIPPSQYRGGAIWNELPIHLKMRVHA
jgi:hypothetical protein